MKVYVIMGNDFPDAVFESEAAAEKYIAAKKLAPESRHPTGGTRIYWRSYVFELQK